MSQNNLAYIDTTVSSSLATDPTPPKSLYRDKVKPQIVAGFNLDGGEAEQAAIESLRNQRKSEIFGYERDKDSLSKSLARRGVTPLAYVPLKVWDELCSQSGLYRLRPTANGTIRVATKDLVSEAGDWADIIQIGLWCAVWAAIGTAVFFAILPHAEVVAACFFTGGIVILGLLVINGMILGGMAGGEPYLAASRGIQHLLLKRFNRKPDAFKAAVLPNKVEPEHGRTARITLPTPPAEVVSVLSKIKDLSPVHVALDASAFAFVDKPTDILRKEVSDYNEERAARFALRLDPIVYFCEGSAVAVVAQFGDFAIEKSLVDKVMGATYLIR